MQPEQEVFPSRSLQAAPQAQPRRYKWEVDEHVRSCMYERRAGAYPRSTTSRAGTPAATRCTCCQHDGRRANVTARKLRWNGHRRLTVPEDRGGKTRGDGMTLGCYTVYIFTHRHGSSVSHASLTSHFPVGCTTYTPCLP